LLRQFAVRQGLFADAAFVAEMAVLELDLSDLLAAYAVFAEMVKRGDSQEQIVAYMTARYGDFVLYRPPVRKSTWLLWFGPLLLLVFSVSMLILHLRRRRNQPAELFDPEFPDDEADVSPEKSK
jgi:cytochrome c-type biogenesis protein CcmH/NrfF